MASSIRQVVVADPGTITEVFSPTALLQGGTPNRFYLVSPTATVAGNVLAAIGTCDNSSGISITQVLDSVNGNWTLCDSIANGNANAVSYYFGNAASVPAGDVGAALGGTTTTLTDNNKSWTVNQWAGAAFHDATSGQSATVASNTSNTLTFTAPITAPAASDTYVVGGWIQFNTSSASAGYTAAVLWEVAGVVTSSVLAGHNKNIQTVTSSGANNITSNTAAMGSSPIMMLSISFTDTGPTAPNAGSADMSDGTLWQFNLGAPIARVQHQNVANPGTLAALFGASTSGDEWLTQMMGFKDASSAAALAGGATVTVSEAGALSTGIPLAGTPSIAESAAAALTTSKPIAGGASISSSAAAALTTGDKLAGAPAVSVTAAGSFGSALAGGATAGAAAAAALTTGIPLAGAPAVSAAVAAALGTGIPLNAAASVLETAVGALGSTDITIGAHDKAQRTNGPTAFVTLTTQAIRSTLVAFGCGNNPVSISDTINGLASGNTWIVPTGGNEPFNAPNGFSVLAYVQNANGGANHVITVTQSGGNGPSIEVVELIGATLSGGPDNFASNNLFGGVAAVASPTIITNTARAAVLTLMGGASNATTAATSALGTIIDTIPTQATFVVMADSVFIEPTTGTPVGDTLTFGGQTFYDIVAYSISFAPRVTAPAALAGSASVSEAVAAALTTGIPLAGAASAAASASGNLAAMTGAAAVGSSGSASLTTGDRLAGAAAIDLEAAALFAGRYRPSRIEIAIYDASSDGFFWGRYPLGNKPSSMVAPATVSAAVTGALNTSIKLSVAAATGITAQGALSGGSGGAALAGGAAVSGSASATLGSAGGTGPGTVQNVVLNASPWPGAVWASFSMPAAGSAAITGFQMTLSTGEVFTSSAYTYTDSASATVTAVACVVYGHGLTSAVSRTCTIKAMDANGNLSASASAVSNAVTSLPWTDQFQGSDCVYLFGGGSLTASAPLNPAFGNQYFDFSTVRAVQPGTATNAGTYVPALNAPAFPSGFGATAWMEVASTETGGFAFLLNAWQNNPLVEANNGIFDHSDYEYLCFVMEQPTGQQNPFYGGNEMDFMLEGRIDSVSSGEITFNNQTFPPNGFISGNTAIFDRTNQGVQASGWSTNTATSVAVTTSGWSAGDYAYPSIGDYIFGNGLGDISQYVTAPSAGVWTNGVPNVVKIPKSALGIVGLFNNQLYKSGFGSATATSGANTGKGVFWVTCLCWSKS